MYVQLEAPTAPRLRTSPTAQAAQFEGITGMSISPAPGLAPTVSCQFGPVQLQVYIMQVGEAVKVEGRLLQLCFHDVHVRVRV